MSVKDHSCHISKNRLALRHILIDRRRGEWPSGLYSLRQVTEVKLGRVRSDFGWVTSEAWHRISPRRPSEGTLN